MAPSSRSRSIPTTQPPVVKEEPKRRVNRACDSCRVKKAKCDGDKPCLRCANDDQVCTYTLSKKPTGRVHSAEYVELLESKVNLLSSSLAILVEVLNRGDDVSHLAQDADTPINQVVEKLQAMNSSLSENQGDKSPVAKKFVTPPQVKFSATPPTKILESPNKQAKPNLASRSPIYQPSTAMGYGYVHKSPSTINAAPDFSDTSDSPLFDEPSDLRGYPAPFSDPMANPLEFNYGPLPMPAPKPGRNFNPAMAPTLSSPPYTQADTAGLRKAPRFTANSLGPPMPQNSVPVTRSHPDPSALFMPASYEGSRPANSRQAPPTGFGALTPPVAFDGMSEDEFSDILTDRDDFLRWQQV